MKSKNPKPAGIMTDAFHRVGFTEERSSVKNKPQPQVKNKIFSLPALRNIGEHGINHINCVYCTGSEQQLSDADVLGTLLSTTYRYNITHPILGKFSSVENMIWYLRTERDRVRHVPPVKVAMMGKLLTRETFDNEIETNRKVQMIPTHLLTVIIGDTYWGIIRNNEFLRKKLLNSSLPFDIYHRDKRTSSLVRPRAADWLCFIYESVRNALKLEEQSGKPTYPDLGMIIHSHDGQYDEISHSHPKYEQYVKEMIDKVCSPIVGILPEDTDSKH